MLDGRHTPDAELVGGLDDVVQPAYGFLVALHVASDRPQRDALLFAFGANHRIDLQDDLDHGAAFRDRRGSVREG